MAGIVFVRSVDSRHNTFKHNNETLHVFKITSAYRFKCISENKVQRQRRRQRTFKASAKGRDECRPWFRHLVGSVWYSQTVSSIERSTPVERTASSFTLTNTETKRWAPGSASSVYSTGFPFFFLHWFALVSFSSVFKVRRPRAGTHSTEMNKKLVQKNTLVQERWIFIHWMEVAWITPQSLWPSRLWGKPSAGKCPPRHRLC